MTKPREAKKTAASQDFRINYITLMRYVCEFFFCAVFLMSDAELFLFSWLRCLGWHTGSAFLKTFLLRFFFICLLSLTFLKSIHIPPSSGQVFIVGQFIFLVGGHWLLTLATGPQKRERESSKKKVCLF